MTSETESPAACDPYLLVVSSLTVMAAAAPNHFTSPKNWHDTVTLSWRRIIMTLFAGRLRKVTWPDSTLANSPLPNISKSGIITIDGSPGGYSVLGLAGAWPTWRDPRAKAVVAFSPFTIPYLANKSFKNIKIPVMYKSGTLDRNSQPMATIFALSNPPKVSMILRLASHLAWSNFICRLTPARECAR